MKLPKRRTIAAAVAIMALATTTHLLQAQTQPATAPSTKEIDALIHQLGDADFQMRETADKKLREIAWPIMSDLIIARSQAKDEETKVRINSIIADICWSTEGLSPENAKALNELRKRDAGRPFEFEMRNPVPVVAAIVGRANYILRTGERSGYIMRNLDDVASVQRLRRASELRAKGAWEELQWESLSQGRLAELALAFRANPGGAEKFARAARCLEPATPPQTTARGSMDEVFSFMMMLPLSEWDEIPGIVSPSVDMPRPSVGDQLELTRLMAAGANGDALAFATTHDAREYQIQLLAEAQDWQTIAKFSPVEDWWDTAKFLPAAGYLNLGDAARADEIVLPVGARAYLRRHHALLGMLDDGLDTCLKLNLYDDAAMILKMQHRYSEILPLVEKSRAAKYRYSGQLEGQIAIMFAQLNEPARAAAIIKRFDAGELDDSGIFNANEADFLLGNTDAVAARLVRFKDNGFGSSAQYPLGPEFARLAPWVDALSGQGKPRDAIYKTIIEIHLGHLPADEMAAILDAPPASPDPREFRPRDLPGSILPLEAAEVFEDMGRDDLVRRYFDAYAAKPDPSFGKGRVSAGAYYQTDFLRNLLGRQNSKLAQRVIEFSAAFPDAEPVIQFVAAVRALRDGRVEQARKMQEDAENLLGADITRRNYLARLLYDMGEPDLAYSQAQQVVAIDAPVSEDRIRAQELLGQIERDRGHFASALQHYRLACFAAFYSSVSLPEDYDYFFQIAKAASYCQSRSELESGNSVLAIRAAVQTIKYDPEDLDLTVPIIAAFQKANAPDQAQSLAKFNRGLLLNILKDFPNSHLHHYLIAKLDLSSGFTNDQTQPHLQKALQLAPANPDYKKLNDSLKP